MDLEGQEYWLGQGATKRCRLSWLTNNALVDEPKCEGGGGGLTSGAWVQLCTWSTNKLWRSDSIWAWRICVNRGVSVNIWELLLTSAQKKKMWKVNDFALVWSRQDGHFDWSSFSVSCRTFNCPINTQASCQHLSLLSWCSVIVSGLVARV